MNASNKQIQLILFAVCMDHKAALSDQILMHCCFCEVLWKFKKAPSDQQNACGVEACALLIKTAVEKCEPTMALSIKDAALAESIVLRHLYQSIFDNKSFDKQFVSRYLISLWLSNHTPAR